MNNQSCFFIGHREASTEILPALESAIEQHISEYGVTEFIVGGYGGFDRLAASAVIRAKRQHPQIALVLLLPYHPAERPIEKPKGFDSTYYPPDMEKVPRQSARFSIRSAFMRTLGWLDSNQQMPVSETSALT